MKRFLQDIFVPTGAGRHGRAEWSLHWLLAASIVLPLLVLAAGSLISYRQHEQEARDRLQRNLSTVYEHALKVLETVELSSRYLDEMLEGVTDQQIRDNEAGFNRRLKPLTDTLPQFADIWIIDADGHPLVSGTVFPVPHELDLSDRDYFRAHKDGDGQGLFVDEVVTSRATNAAASRASSRSAAGAIAPGGRFAGVTVISVSPDYFRDYYATLTPAARRRPDPCRRRRCWRAIRICRGEVARPSPAARSPSSSSRGREAGHPHRPSAIDGKERIFAFRKLPRVDLYVATGFDTARSPRRWMAGMARHLIFGLPATVALIALC